jgi:hypothetical protein
MIDKIKEVIDNKVKNLHPEVEKKVIESLLKTNLKCKYKILQYIRKILELPSVGSDKYSYWEKRGWSDEEIKEKRVIKKMPSSPMKIENWMKKINEKTGNLYTESEAIYKIKSFRKFNIEYWIERGFSKDESEIKVRQFQKENSEKFIKKSIQNPEKYLGRTQTQLQYWINKGFNEEESKSKLKERQDTNSLSFFIKKYGEIEGELKFNDRLNRYSYSSSRKFYTDKYGEEEGNNIYNEICSKRTVKINKSSKEAYHFLIPIYKNIRKSGIKIEDIYWGVGSSKEWFINSNKCLFFYDFMIKPLNIIIEYHGVSFHPKEGQTDWVSAYGDDYENKIKIDNLKKDLAESNGYKYFFVYSDEDIKTKQYEFIELIKKEISNSEKNRR